MKQQTPPKNIDAYIAQHPKHVQELLQTFRKTIHAAAPNAEEVISYQMPAFRYKGMLVYFAGYKNHIGFYPVSSAIRVFAEELSAYACSKGTVKFQLDKPLPVKLITRMVKFRVKENEMKETVKLKEKKPAKKK